MIRSFWIFIGCLALYSCKVRPSAFMPSGSVSYAIPGEASAPPPSEIRAAEPPGQASKASPEIISIAPEPVAVGEAPRIKKKSSPKITFRPEAARPDSIPEQRKTEPMGIAAALTATVGFVGLISQFVRDPLIFLLLLAAGASFGIASLVRIRDQPRRFKGRFGGWYSIFLASLPIWFIILLGLSYR